MIKIVCVGGNPCQEIINGCLQSFVDQTFKDWEMVVVLDPGKYNIVVEDPRIKIHFNENSMLGTYNTVLGVAMLKPKDDDIIVFMDGDDWLREDALELVAAAYDDSDVLVTHGSWNSFPPGWGGSMCRDNNNSNNPYKREDYKDIRRARWHGSALRTMKHLVYRRIKDEDLRDKEGVYFTSGCDVALMFPALEMAGFDRVKFIEEQIYTYNVTGVRTPHTHRNESQEHLRQIININRYERIK